MSGFFFVGSYDKRSDNRGQITQLQLTDLTQPSILGGAVKSDDYERP